METFFENSCFYNESNLLEMAKKTMKPGFVIWCSVLISLCSVVGIAALILGGVCTIPGIILLIGAVLLGYRLYSTPKKLSLLVYKRNIELYHSEVETQTTFYDDSFMGKNIQSKSEIKFNYERVAAIKETKELFLLIFPENLAILVDKNGFKVGTKEGFLEFMKAKCPAAKLKLMQGL